MDSEWIKNLNVEGRTIKLIGNVEEALFLGTGKDFLETQKLMLVKN